MFSWINKEQNRQTIFKMSEVVSVNLKEYYQRDIFPLENFYLYHDLFSPELDDAYFSSIPMVLVLGDKLSGKTSFLNYIIQKKLPTLQTGGGFKFEKFNIIMHAMNESVVCGKSLVRDKNVPFSSLSKLGNSVLDNVECSFTYSDVLKKVSFVDTPPIPTKEKLDALSYDFLKVIGWFTERVDLIILMFDAKNLYISDEFLEVIKCVSTHEQKIRILFNKADAIDPHELLRRFGELMLTIGQVLNCKSSEVMISSFQPYPYKNSFFKMMFRDDEQKLFLELNNLARTTGIKKLETVIKRAKSAKINALIIGGLKKKMPNLFSKNPDDVLKNLKSLFEDIKSDYNFSADEFPPAEELLHKLKDKDISKLPVLKQIYIEKVNNFLHDLAPKLMIELLKQESEYQKEDLFSHPTLLETNPFFNEKDAVEPRPSGWLFKYVSVFNDLNPLRGKVNGATVKKEFLKSGLPNTILFRIWNLADIDQDGLLDGDEFAVAMELIQMKLKGYDLPIELPEELTPPSKKQLGH